MNQSLHLPRRGQLARCVLGTFAFAAGIPAGAAEIANTDLFSVRWDNTIQYTAGVRTARQSALFTSAINQNDGDLAFKRGDLMTNRVDVLTEFDVALKDEGQSGLRISAAGWYDRVYNRPHDAIDPSVYNLTSVPNNRFSDYAERVAGREIELLDAFLYTSMELAGHRASLRVGRHTLIWGESLFLGTNGIAAAQAPVNGIKALTVPSTQAKELFMPVNQISGSFNVNAQFDVAAYYQMQWKPSRMPIPGTYWSPADHLFNGGEQLLLAPGVGVPRGADVRPEHGRGQWGLALKYRDPVSDMDLGLYYLSYTSKLPLTYLRGAAVPGVPGPVPVDYVFVYPEHISLLGVSASSKIGDANVAGEISVRNNMPLASDASKLFVQPGQVADSHDNPLYAVGRTLHAQASVIMVTPRTAFWDTGSITAEIGGSHLMKVTKNAGNRDRSTARTTLGTRIVFEPTWYQVMPQVELSAPVVLGYTFTGVSALDPSFNGTGAGHGGDVGIGLNFKYANNLRGGLNYTHYLGKDRNNSFGDRDFLTLSVRYSF